MRATLVASVCTAALMLPASADAASAHIAGENRFGETVLLFEASPGETNDVVVAMFEESSRHGFTITDYGATIVPGTGCVAVDSHSVRCFNPFGSDAQPEVRLGDMNDRLRTVAHEGTSGDACCSGMRIVGNGGTGDDFLAVSAADDFTSARFDGGGGRDRLHGSVGNDFFTDGDRDDAPGDLGPNRDIIDGGPAPAFDRDTVSYEQRTRPVSVNLTRSRGPERDLLNSIESAVGGSGDDRLTGTDKENLLHGGPGRNAITAGRGDDLLFVGSGGAEVKCGKGRDVVYFDDNGAARDYLEPRCERVVFASTDIVTSRPGAVGHAAYPQLTRRSFRWEVGCNVSGTDEESGDLSYECGGRITVREALARRRLLASATHPPHSTEVPSTVVRMRFTHLGRRLAFRRNGVRAVVRVTPRRYPAVTWAITLKCPSFGSIEGRHIEPNQRASRQC